MLNASRQPAPRNRYETSMRHCEVGNASGRPATGSKPKVEARTDLSARVKLRQLFDQECKLDSSMRVHVFSRRPADRTRATGHIKQEEPTMLWIHNLNWTDVASESMRP